MNKKVYIILLNYNGWKDTIECLESILKNNYDNYQIIVVDNDSPNKSMGYIINWAEGKQEVVYDENSQLKHLSQPHEQKPLNYVFYTKEEALKGGVRDKELKLNNPIIFIQSDENGGFAAGNNVGIKYALAKDDFEYIWLLNNDTVIENNTLSKFVKSFANHMFYGGMSNATHSVIFSGPFTEDDFDTSAGEIKVGDVVTGLKVSNAVEYAPFIN